MAGSGFRMVMQTAGLRRGLEAVSRVAPDASQRQMQVACLHLEGEIKARAPVDTGYLRASYRSRAERRGNVMIGHVGTNTDYALPQEFIHNPHVRVAIDANRQQLVNIMLAQTLQEALRHA